MNDKIRLSIIVPVYNAEPYLERCLQSIYGQEYHDYEVILVDDGSTDASPVMCDNMSGQDSRFVTIHKSNGGVSSARNEGLEIAKGEYIMFLDSDDALLPCALEDIMETVSGEDIVICGYAEYRDGRHFKEVRPNRTYSFRGREFPLFMQENIRKNCEMLDAPWAKLFRRSAIGDVRFCDYLNYAEDKLFVFTVLSGCSSVLAMSNAVYAYHVRPGSLGSDLTSDRHVWQLMTFLPRYSEVLDRLKIRCPSVRSVARLYHNDVVGRYVCRILNILATRRTTLLNRDNVRWLYDLMDHDTDLGLFSIRPGQFFNLLLYKTGRIGLTIAVYRFTSFMSGLFRKDL